MAGERRHGGQRVRERFTRRLTRGVSINDPQRRILKDLAAAEDAAGHMEFQSTIRRGGY